MRSINVINPNKEFELMLCKPNRIPIAMISVAKITSIDCVLDDIDSITFEISDVFFDRFTRNTVRNYAYDEIHEERLVLLNNSDYFVIKSIDESKGDINTKTITVYSIEQKLNRINISLEDVGIVLCGEDKEDNDIAILDLLYSETGWKVGHVDDDVRYEKVGDKYQAKYRWQESISDNWYTFLTSTITDTFGCIIVFDTKNKVINLYSLDTYGENIGLYLSRDNYMKSIAKKSSTENIVTRLSLFGKDEIDIRAINPMGKDYIEDYSYFIENDDMSEELVLALDKHDKIVSDNQAKWEVFSKERTEKSQELIIKNAEYKVVCDEIKVLISMKNSYEQNNDDDNALRIQLEIDEKEVIKIALETEIRTIEGAIKRLGEEIAFINKQTDRIYASDENGDIIFSEELLLEFNEFLYYDTYSNSCYLTQESLLDGGKRELSRRCIPTVEYSIDSVNFLKRVLNNKNIAFQGELSLGDIVILYDEKLREEIWLYFVGYSFNPTDNSLQITLSNKKSKVNNTKSIADYLKQAKKSKEYFDSKAYILNQIKYNKI